MADSYPRYERTKKIGLIVALSLASTFAGSLVLAPTGWVDTVVLRTTSAVSGILLFFVAIIAPSQILRAERDDIVDRVRREEQAAKPDEDVDEE